MKILRSIATCFMMFSRIPMPHIEWREENMRYMMAAFPLIGIVIGTLDVGWWLLAGYLGIGTFLRAAGWLLIAFALTGGIHLDGFIDVTDALSSHAEPARMREILKDSHVGAFAAMCVAIYLIMYVALLTEMPDALNLVILLGLAQVLERALSGIGVTVFRKASDEGMLAMFQVSAEKRPVLVALIIWVIACVAAMVWLDPVTGLVMAVVAIACLEWTRRLANKKFGGMSGDLSGWFLQWAEILMVACIVIVHLIAG